ncbi:hypothetical protein ABPG74_010413 [Tetrahymena malaccensis]
MGNVCPSEANKNKIQRQIDEEESINSNKKANKTLASEGQLQTDNGPRLSQEDEEVEGQPVCIMSRKKNKKISVKDFQLKQVLGKGSFGKVVLVEKKDTKELYAMKILKKDYIQYTNQKFNTQQERDILVKMNSPFIVKLHYAFQTADKLYIVMDFMIGGELFYHLRRSPIFTEEKAAYYSAEIILGIEALHSNNIIYRDLKPENILIDHKGHLRLADFGLSKKGVKDHERTNSLCGTPEYLAPEILLNNGHTKMVDWWSLGAILYEMLTGAPPFYNKNQKQMFKDRFLKPIEMKEWFSPAAKSLLSGLLNINPELRLGFKGIQEIKEHEFYASLNWDKLYKKEIPPPYKPKLSSKYDLSHFSKQFTTETVKDTPYCGKTIKDSYNDFTYQRNDINSAALKSQMVSRIREEVPNKIEEEKKSINNEITTESNLNQPLINK